MRVWEKPPKRGPALRKGPTPAAVTALPQGENQRLRDRVG